ncbi:MAG TPA: DsbA family oxidoreductase [Pseudogracilibacillus sp.]|nr:DsbA family oxidoreductase [Pseudogracilibacillus sp.]
MKIEIWSDYTCPFCYIGKRNLETALRDFSGKDQVEVEFKSYQLDPNAEKYTGQDFYESMAAKFGGVERAKQMTAGIAEQAKEVGLTFHFDTMKPTNTFDAHRLNKYACQQGKDQEIAEKLLQANFTDSEDVGNLETLANIAEDVGLDKTEALETLQDETAFRDDVNTDLHEAQQFGITSVPFFLINRKYAISGAQPVETFTQALEKVLEEEQPKPVFQDLSGESATDAACAEGSCANPNTTDS